MDFQGRKLCEGKKIEDWWEEILKPKSITSSLSWTDLGWRKAESRTAIAGKHKWFPQTLFLLFQIWLKRLLLPNARGWMDAPCSSPSLLPQDGPAAHYHRIYSGKHWTSRRSQKSQSHRNNTGFVHTRPLTWGGVFAFPSQAGGCW